MKHAPDYEYIIPEMVILQNNHENKAAYICIYTRILCESHKKYW